MQAERRPLAGGRHPVRVPLLALLLAVLLGILVVLPLAAQSGERIAAFDVTITVLPDGDLFIDERIEYDFGGAERRGIFRNIPFRYHYDEQYFRLIPITVLEVDSESGAPDDYLVEELGGETTIRIGDPDQTITGVHVYRIRYRVEGALNGFDTHDELYWNATGDGWEVPIERVTVRVEAPAEVQEAICFAGPFGSNWPCDAVIVTDATSTFTHTGLRPYEGVTIVVAIPPGVVPAPAPILEERWSFSRAFSLTPLTVGATGGLSLLVLVAMTRTLWLVGRDRRWRGLT